MTSSRLAAAMRNKMRITLMVGCLITGIVIIYRTLGESSWTSDYPKDGKKGDDNNSNNNIVNDKNMRWRKPSKPFENVNELMDLKKQPSMQNRHVVYESQVLTPASGPKLNPYYNKVQWKNRPANVVTMVPQKNWDDPQPHQSQNKLLALADTNSIRDSPIRKDPLPFDHKLVHLDLKGAPPRISYFEQIFPLFAKWGVTGVLIEYEDMFPYWGSLRELGAYNAYSHQEVKRLLQLARKYNLEVMPLVQTFGHMEFILKQSTFMGLREVSAYPQVVCPTQNMTMDLIKTMIDQMLALHPKINYLHIGADEVYYLGNCNYCLQKMTSKMWDKNKLFLEHVKLVAKYVKSKGVKAIMWDDMFRQIPEDDILASGIYKHVEIMAWRYGRDIVSELPPDVWNKYGNLFSGVWVASSFKGATGPAQYVTQISHHLENHMAWLQTIEAHRHHVPFRGIAITGWQRYDHFAVLCELLPASIPSLVVNLLLLQTGSLDTSLLARATQVLDCMQPISLEPDAGIIVRCAYPGSRIYEGVQMLYSINTEVDVMVKGSYMSGWLSQYNIDMRFSSPALVDSAYQKLQELKRNLTLLRDDMVHAMNIVYDQYVVSEWLHLHLKPLEKKADDWLDAARELQMQEVWPRRPLVQNQSSSTIRHYRDEVL